MSNTKKPTAAAAESKEVRREVVSVGMDFRPVLINLGDGRIWEFSPDPSTEQWAAMQSAMDAFDGVKENDADAMDKVAHGRDLLEDAIVGLLVADPNEFRGKGYGLFALQKLAVVLMETLTGFPTKQSKSSGTRRGTSGPT